MTDTKQSMFGDRRRVSDRRTQNLSMPAGLDRRMSSRRNQQFYTTQSWWLQIDYATELVSEKLSSGQREGETSNKHEPLSEHSD